MTTWGKTAKTFPRSIFLTQQKQRAKGVVGEAGSGAAGSVPDSSNEVPPGFHANEGGGPFMVPEAIPFTPVSYEPIKPANYSFTDPQEFAAKFGEFNRGEYEKNFTKSSDYALRSLQTELQGLRNFAPAAAALKREQTALDNPFNQWQRTSQVNSVLPNANPDLEAQRRRANTYALGQAPDSITDRALELGVRSRAADSAAFSGFGPNSMQASKLSDLMSAEQRLQLAQYGENLLGQNLQTSANLNLAPTEYSNAGEGINVMPEVGAGRLALQEQGMINAATMIEPATALTSKINQEQFKTNLEQRTNEFNASNALQAAEFNSSGAFQAAATSMAYSSQYAQQVAGYNTGQENQALATGLAGTQGTAFNSAIQGTQQSDAITSVISGMSEIPSAINAIRDIAGSFSSDSTGTKQTKSAEAEQGGVASGSNAPLVSAVDSASPATIKFADGAPTPQGYVPVGTNSDGTVSAASVKDYEAELTRFSENSRTPTGSVTVQNAAAADRAIAQAAGLSYQPLPNFQQVALTGAGKPVYSSIAAASSNDMSALTHGPLNLGVALGTLGVMDPTIAGELAVIDDATGPDLLPGLDAAFAEGGPGAVAAALQNRLLGGRASLASDTGQRLAFQAHRIGELWGALSPGQRAGAISSMIAPALNHRAKKDIAAEKVPWTDKAPHGPLTTGQVLGMSLAGLNGHGAARNWRDVSAFGAMLGAKTPEAAAQAATRAGLVGHGAAGAAVRVNARELYRSAALPAPEVGIGAAIFPRTNKVPAGYQVVAKTPSGKPIAMPKSLAHTSSLGKTPLGYSKAKTIASGKHQAQQLWGKAPLGDTVRGSVGGSAMVAGLGQMVGTNPGLLGSMIAHSLFSEVTGG